MPGIHFIGDPGHEPEPKPEQMKAQPEGAAGAARVVGVNSDK